MKKYQKIFNFIIFFSIIIFFLYSFFVDGVSFVTRRDKIQEYLNDGKIVPSYLYNGPLYEVVEYRFGDNVIFCPIIAIAYLFYLLQLKD